MQLQPKISIITVVFNAEAVVEKTIQSVLQQTYTAVEYIIIDGGSTDGTLAIIEEYHPRIAFLLSEKDDGIYDAMNKGLQKATGEYVLFLNAGDLLADNQILANVFSNASDADVYYGDTKIIDVHGSIKGERRLKPPAKLTWKSLQFGMCVSHQSFIAKRALCEPYDLTYKISSDIDWVITILKKSSKVVNVKQTISLFLEGGTSVKLRKKALFERLHIMIKHYGFIPTLFNHVFILLRYVVHVAFRKSMS